MQGIHLRKYGVAATIDFELYEVDGVDFRVDWTPAAGDVFMMRDEAAEEQVTNAGGNADLSTLVADEGRAYSITLALEDMQAARVVVYLVDQATKAFLDKVLVIETYGHASAQHAIDLDDGVRAGLTALPNAAADAAGGLPISDDGGLDMDSILEKMLAYVRLLARSDAAVETDAATELTAINADEASGAGNFSSQTDSEEGIRDHIGDGTNLTEVGLTTDAVDADALKADAVAEIWAAAMTDLAAGAPAKDCSALTALNWLFEAWRNKVQVTASEIAVYKDDGSTKLTESDISDDGTTFEKGEYGAVD